jgi:hypothetical protein
VHSFQTLKRSFNMLLRSLITFCCIRVQCRPAVIEWQLNGDALSTTSPRWEGSSQREILRWGQNEVLKGNITGEQPFDVSGLAPDWFSWWDYWNRLNFPTVTCKERTGYELFISSEVAQDAMQQLALDLDFIGHWQTKSSKGAGRRKVRATLS